MRSDGAPASTSAELHFPSGEYGGNGSLAQWRRARVRRNFSSCGGPRGACGTRPRDARAASAPKTLHPFQIPRKLFSKKEEPRNTLSHKRKLSIFIADDGCKGTFQCPDATRELSAFFLPRNRICIYFSEIFSLFHSDSKRTVGWPEAVQTWSNLVCLSHSFAAHIEFFGK